MQNDEKQPAVASPIEPVVMSRRDYFAAAALQGLLANSFSDGYSQPLSLASQEEMAAMARDQADYHSNNKTWPSGVSIKDSE